jgi:phosphatidate phosphatase PAH1
MGKIDSDFSPELYSQFETTGHHIVADRYTDIRQRGNLKYLYAKRLGARDSG